MRVRVQQEQKFLVTTERALRQYDNAFIFTNQSEVDFGITLVLGTQNVTFPMLRSLVEATEAISVWIM